MANGKKTYRFYDAPIGGVNLTKPDARIDDIEMASSLNMIVRDDLVQTRFGCESAANSSVGQPMLMGYHYNASYNQPRFQTFGLSAGKVWGLDLSLIDYDEGAPAYERSQLVWSGEAPWINPHEFGFLLLTP